MAKERRAKAKWNVSPVLYALYIMVEHESWMNTVQRWLLSCCTLRVC